MNKLFKNITAKNILLSFITILTSLSFISCSANKDVEKHPEWSYNSVVYEMNIRQQSVEGNFAAARERLPFLKELGVDIVWLMPIHPIGEKGRKGTLGSYYAIRDYKAVNPEFGTMQDFEKFLTEAHDLGLKVILDLVANHTSPDSEWVDGKPAEWYYRDSTGAPMVQYDWTDISRLNYACPEVGEAMTDVMKFWVNKGIDGFRCDVAGEVPDSFWKKAIAAVRDINPELYFLAEGEGVHFNEAGFDATYSWELLHLLEDIVADAEGGDFKELNDKNATKSVAADDKRIVSKNKKGAKDLRALMDKYSEEYPVDAFKLMFTSNHDENSWSGSEFERYGDAVKTMAVLTYTLPKGQPLIYTGQEIGNDHRFEFFEKDPVEDWTENEYTDFYRRMNAFKHSHSLLASGEKGSEAKYLELESVEGNVEDVFAFSRENDSEKILCLFNLSPEKVVCKLPSDIILRGASSEGKSLEGKSSEEKSLEDSNITEKLIENSVLGEETIEFKPWGYSVVVIKK